MQINRVCWHNCKPFIEALHELRYKRISRSDITDSSQSEFFYKPILQCAIHTLNSAFSLAGVGAEDLDVQLRKGTPELSHTRTTFSLPVDAEYRVFVGIESDRNAMRHKVSAQSFKVGFGAFTENKLQLHKTASSIVDEDQQGAGFTPFFKPAVITPVDLN
jgi:hypothetical protein